MKRGDIVDYSFPALVDDDGAPRRAQPQIVTLPAVVLRASATTADIEVFGERWWSPRVVLGVAFDDGTAKTANRNQANDRVAAIDTNTLDGMRDNVKGWVKARV